MKFILHTQLTKTGNPIVGTLSSDKTQCLFSEDETGINFLLEQPEIIFINPDGIMLRGFEPDGVDKTGRKKYKYQEWYCRWIVESA